jgi:hypothetical protein
MDKDHEPQSGFPGQRSQRAGRTLSKRDDLGGSPLGGLQQF